MSHKASRALASAEEIAALEGLHRNQMTPAVRPRDAATLIIVDRSGGAPKVLMGRRNPKQKFMPGQFVFPGGRTDPGDGRVAVSTPLDALAEQKLLHRVQRPSAAKARAFALSAIRETFEETGVLIGSTAAGGPKMPEAGPWSAFARHGVTPDLSRLYFLARAITPPMRPKRYDTRFFVTDAAAIAATVEGVAGPDSELVEIAWVSLAETLKMDLPRITRVIVEDLAEALNSGLNHQAPVPFYLVRNRQYVVDRI